LSRSQDAVKVLNLLSWTLKFAQVAVAALWKFPTEKFPEILRPMSPWIQNYAWVMLLLLPVLIVAVEWAERRLTIPWFRAALRDALNEMRDKGFDGGQFKGSPLDHHRVTLFRYQYFCWKRFPYFGGFMVPKLRTGHLTQRTKFVFRAPDTPDLIEGIAGQAFRNNEIVVVTGLPDIRSANASDDDIALYAKMTFISKELARRYRPRARAYMGMPVEIGGKPLWTLVVDSQVPDCEKALERIERRYRTVFNHFLKFLENMP